MARRADGLSTPTGGLADLPRSAFASAAMGDTAHHLVHGHRSVGKGNCSQDDAQRVEPVGQIRHVSTKSLSSRRNQRSRTLLSDSSACKPRAPAPCLARREGLLPWAWHFWLQSHSCAEAVGSSRSAGQMQVELGDGHKLGAKAPRPSFVAPMLHLGSWTFLS